MTTAWMTFLRGSACWRGAVADTSAVACVRGPGRAGARWRAYQPPTANSTTMAISAAAENHAMLDCPCGTTTKAASSGPEAEPDRKSTRLNSSHSSISYAVFCLKKKKKHTILHYSKKKKKKKQTQT